MKNNKLNFIYILHYMLYSYKPEPLPQMRTSFSLFFWILQYILLTRKRSFDAFFSGYSDNLRKTNEVDGNWNFLEKLLQNKDRPLSSAETSAGYSNVKLVKIKRKKKSARRLMGRRKRPSAVYFALFSASLEHKDASAEEREDRPLKAQIRLFRTCHQNTLISFFIYLF